MRMLLVADDQAPAERTRSASISRAITPAEYD
jgi:hypothetical protein